MKRIFFVLTVAVLFSCKKNKDCKQDMGGISGTYRFTSASYKVSAAGTPTDYFTDACERDDQITFNANGTYNFTDAGVKCVPAGDYTSTWSVSGSTMTIDGDDGAIQSFNCSTLVLVASDVNVAGDRLTFTLTRL